MKNQSRNSIVSLAAALALAASSLFSTGCVVVAAGAAGAGAVAWVRGELQANLSAAPESVMDATEEAIREMKFFVMEEKRDALSAVYEMRNSQDEKITILVEQQADGVTQVRIRVGIFGNQVLSQTILDQIEGNL